MPDLLDAASHDVGVTDGQDVEQHVLNVVASAHFMRAETLRKLLLYLWQNRRENISEYAVGVEALGRRSDFDPKTDASVRVQISRLRRKLKDFYEVEGLGELWRLQIPVGTHTIVLVHVAGQEPDTALAPPTLPDDLPGTGATPASPGRHTARNVTLALLTLAVVAATVVWTALHRQAHPPEIKATTFWASLATPGSPVKIVLPTPVFFTFPKNSALHVRDTAINDYDRWTDSPVLRGLVPQQGEPALDHAYTVTTDTLAAITLGRYLDRVGLGHDVSFEVSDDRSMDLLEQSSVVAFGAHSTLVPFREYLRSMNFSLSVGEVSVENTSPLPGEQKRYLFSRTGQASTVEPAIVAVLPGRTPGRKLIILQARHTASLIAMLTSKVGDEMVQKMYRDRGSPEYFEMVVLSELNGDHTIRSWPVALHPYRQNAPIGQM